MLEGIIRRVLRAVFGGGGAVDIDLPQEFTDLKAALTAAVEAAIDSGTATGGSNITIVDTGKSWAVNMWADATFEVTIAGVHYLGLVTSNTVDTITVPALAGGAIVVVGSEYSLKRPVTLADISDRAARLLGVVYGSQAQQLLQRAVTFDLIAQLRSAGVEIDPRDVIDRATRLLGVTYGSQAQQLQQRAATFELLVQLMSAGAEIDPRDVTDRATRLLGVTYGSQAQQLQQRAATFELLVQLMSGGAEIDPRDVSDRAARLLGVIYGSQAAQIQQTAANNLMISHEEAAIAVPADIQARYNVKSIRDIIPGAPGTFWLPAAGNIDLSNFIHSSWYIYAPTTATMTVNCYLNISHDGGTTWRRAEGYEILDGTFVRDVWNSIDVPLMLCEAKLEVIIGVAAPATLDLMCIRKA